MSDVEVLQVPERGRWELRVDGELASFADYEDVDDRRVFPHVETLPAFQMHGHATSVVLAALEATIAEGKRIVPACPFARAVVTEHDELRAHVA